MLQISVDKAQIELLDLSNAASVRIKTSLYRVQNGSFKIPALQVTEETRSIPPISESAYNTAFQVEDFIADLAGGRWSRVPASRR